MWRRKSPKRQAAPLADIAPAFDADVARALNPARQARAIARRSRAACRRSGRPGRAGSVAGIDGDDILGGVRRRCSGTVFATASGGIFARQPVLAEKGIACTRSFQREIACSADLYGVAESLMSQPLSMRHRAEAEAATQAGCGVRQGRHAQRRIDHCSAPCGSVGAWVSVARPSVMASNVFGTSATRTTCTTRNAATARHEQEMHHARGGKSAEGPGQPAELDRFPDGQAGEEHHAQREQHAPVEGLLHGVVFAQAMAEPEGGGGEEVAQECARGVSGRKSRRKWPVTTPFSTKRPKPKSRSHIPAKCQAMALAVPQSLLVVVARYLSPPSVIQ